MGKFNFAPTWHEVNPAQQTRNSCIIHDANRAWGTPQEAKSYLWPQIHCLHISRNKHALTCHMTSTLMPPIAFNLFT